MASVPPVYCVDTSSFVDLPRHYPQAVFPAVWTSLEQLVAAGRLIAPKEVLRELAKKDDVVHNWAKANGHMFVNLDGPQQTVLLQIMADFPTWVDSAASTPVADPFVIALARSGGAQRCVVSHELPGGPGAVKIPNVCQRYSVEHLRLVDVFVREGWTFHAAGGT